MDSDFEDDNEVYGLTSVLLGFTDEEPTASNSVKALDNHLGGRPIWLDAKSSPPDLSISKCQACKTLMPLLVQIAAPLSDTFYDRSLYVFACRNPECRRKPGSIRAIRSIKRDSQKETYLQTKEEDIHISAGNGKPNLPVGNLFEDLSDNPTSTSNPFGGSSNPFESSNPFASKQIPLEKDKKKEPVRETEPAFNDTFSVEDIGRPEFPCYLIEVESEELTAPQIDPDVMKRIVTEDPEDETNAESSSNTDPINTVDTGSLMDRTFQHFVDIVESNPGQVLRYERPLKPLLYNDSDVLAEKPEDKTLEFQIMPYTIMVLEAQEDDIMNGMEWGTILIATSDEDTKDIALDDHGVGYAEEWVGVQWEEEIK